MLEALLGKETIPRSLIAGIRAVGTTGDLGIMGLKGYFVAFYDTVDIPALKELIEKTPPFHLQG